MAETSAMWPSEREILKKIVGLHNVDAISALSADTFSQHGKSKSRKPPGFQQQQQEKKPSLEDLMYQYINKTDNTLQHQHASLKNLETQIGQIAAALSGRTQGTLPSNTETNPKEQVKAITTRSGVQLPEIHVTRHE
ncbi:Uncharacterized protein Adt_13624 [Abeliophyllum distichum]|uniref:Uncharacterized protein n=1 Tax=Abeliophyllum distichum TaxID=126358 RepID=A0ABD1TXB9_9LAMI